MLPSTQTLEVEHQPHRASLAQSPQLVWDAQGRFEQKAKSHVEQLAFLLVGPLAIPGTQRLSLAHQPHLKSFEHVSQWVC